MTKAELKAEYERLTGRKAPSNIPKEQLAAKVEFHRDFITNHNIIRYGTR